MASFDEFIKGIGHSIDGGGEDGIDRIIIGDVIAMVIDRGMEWGQPNASDP